MSDRKSPSGIPDGIKAIAVATFLVVIFIINQIYYHMNKPPNENKDSKADQSVEYIYDSQSNATVSEEDLQKQLEEKRKNEIVEKLQISSYNDVVYDEELWDGNYYIVAKSDATKIGEGTIRYIVETDGIQYLREVSWSGSEIFLDENVQDPFQVASKFVRLFFTMRDGTSEEERQEIWDVMSANIDPYLAEDLTDPMFPSLEVKTIANVFVDVVRLEQTVIVSAILGDYTEDDHAAMYSIFSVYVSYDSDEGIWRVVDMDVRKDGDTSGLQDGYRLYQ